MGIDKILIADKDFAFVNSLKNGLQQFGQFVVLTAPDGKHALRILSTQKISLVVTALDLPKLDGLELLAAMTRDYPNVLSIVSTSLQQGILEKKNTGDSLFSFLNKPYDHVKLHSEIIKVLDCLDEIHFRPGIYPASLLPLIHLYQKTCQLDIQGEKGKKGSIFLNKGMLCDGVHGDSKGRTAVENMLAWEPCKCWFKELPPSYAQAKADEYLTRLMLKETRLISTTPPKQKKTAPTPPPTPGPELPKPVDKPIVELSKTVPEEPTPSPPVPEIAVSDKTKQCRVVIIDDSNLLRETLRKILLQEPGIEIAGEGGDNKETLELVKEEKPDVVILDIKMKGIDGLKTLKYLMIHSPTPVIIFSILAREGAAVTFDALKFGAVDFMAKTTDMLTGVISPELNDIINKIHHAAGVKLDLARYIRSVQTKNQSGKPVPAKCKNIVCFGAGEGGYSALLKIIPSLSVDLPAAYFVILHAVPQHVDAFINYLNRYCNLNVRRAVNGATVEGATCYLGSGRENIVLQEADAGQMIMQVRPASSNSENGPIDIFMSSMANILKKKAVGVILSGVGKDGTEGLKNVKKSGGKTIIQDPVFSLYKEMAQNAERYVDKKDILPESKIANAVSRICVKDL